MARANPLFQADEVFRTRLRDVLCYREGDEVSPVLLQASLTLRSFIAWASNRKDFKRTLHVKDAPELTSKDVLYQTPAAVSVMRRDSKAARVTGWYETWLRVGAATSPVYCAPLCEHTRERGLFVSDPVRVMQCLTLVNTGRPENEKVPTLTVNEALEGQLIYTSEQQMSYLRTIDHPSLISGTTNQEGALGGPAAFMNAAPPGSAKTHRIPVGWAFSCSILVTRPSLGLVPFHLSHSKRLIL